jgi:hypothetical protein
LMAAVSSLFDAAATFPSVAAALEDARANRNLDMPLLLRSWSTPSGSIEAARLCRCIRASVQGNAAGVTAEPVSEGWTAGSWEEADELRLLRKDGSLIAALSREGDDRRSAGGRDCAAWRSTQFDGGGGDELLVGYVHPAPSRSAVPSGSDVGLGQKRRSGGSAARGGGLFACCGSPAAGVLEDSEPTTFTVVGSLRAAAEGPHGTSGPSVHAKPNPRSAVLKTTVMGEELSGTGARSSSARLGRSHYFARLLAQGWCQFTKKNCSKQQQPQLLKLFLCVHAAPTCHSMAFRS